MQKTKKSNDVTLSLKLPSKRVREKFLIMFDLQGCIKAVNYLTQYYKIRKMKINLNEKRVGKHRAACYYQNQAYFKRNTLTKRIVLHELYHHLINSKKIELPRGTEEKEARTYAREFRC